MDNPQHYQPLSYALHPPLTAPPARSPFPFTPPSKPASTTPTITRNGERDDDEEHEEDDEGIVEGQLEPTSAAPSPPRIATQQQQPEIQIVQDTGVPGENKRRPGRPRGSKNRKPRAPAGTHNGIHPGGQAPTGPQHGSLPPHPDHNSQNQQYYEFQWRILNLCAEFYEAAEQLVKGTNPLVIAQCYHMGPLAKLDPLTMLGNAKRICDTLLANPSQLVANPPPPLYPPLPTLYASSSGLNHLTTAPLLAAHQQLHHLHQQATATSNIVPGSGAAPTSPLASVPIITNPQTFVVPLSTAPPPSASTTTVTTTAGTGTPAVATTAVAGYGTAPPAAAQYSVYAAHPGYSTTPYYAAAPPPPHAHAHAHPHHHQYPYAPAGYYQPQQPHTQPQQAVASGSGSAVVMSTPAAAPGAAGVVSASIHSSSGAWGDDEVERLRRLAEESKGTNPVGEIDWEHVVKNFGDKRSRHQILIKATNMGLKESSTRGTKRRRGDDGQAVSVEGPTTAAAVGSNTTNTTTPGTATASGAGNGGGPSSSPAMGSLQSVPPQPQQPMGTTNANNTSSPSQSHQSVATPHASPALSSLQRPSSSAASHNGGSNNNATNNSSSSNPAGNANTGVNGSSSSSASSPWPMPTVAAVGAGSPRLPPATTLGAVGGGAGVGDLQQQRTTSYYRPRPHGVAGDKGVGAQQQQQHHYGMYGAANGHSGMQDSGR